MKLLIKATILFIFGLYVDCYKRYFDALMDRRIKRGGDIASRRLTKISNKSYSLYVKFLEMEKGVQRETELIH